MTQKKVYIYTVLIFFLFGTSYTYADNQMFNNELKVHIITPPLKINWSSPRTLSLTAAINSMLDDYAPIGHFAVEVNCQNQNKYGINRIATGMERISKKESKVITLKEKLGLKSLFHSFRGGLVSAKQTLKEVSLAKKEKRLTTVTIPISSSRCDSIMSFMESWIDSGSYTVYGGSKDVINGEGSGCADFALEIFKIATDVIPADDLFVKIYIPNELIGNDKRKVGFSKLLLSKKWSTENDLNSTYFSIPDANRVADYIRINSVKSEVNYIYLKHLLPDEDIGLWPVIMHKFLVESLNIITEKMPDYHKNSFDFKFKYEKSESTLSSWNKIKL